MKAIYLEEAIERFIQAGQNISKDQAIYILNRLPYTEIVRCRECKHWRPHSQHGYDYDDDAFHDYCGLLIPDDDYYAVRRGAWDFCSYGEREER